MSAADVLPPQAEPEGLGTSAAEYAQQIHARYQSEKIKRVRSEGLGQFIDLRHSDRFGHYIRDPWIDRSIPPERPRTDKCKVLILGSGFGALCYGVHLVEAGFKPEDLLFVDSAGGFGGTWYWNRYPGLMCDVESYLYMPLLEATGYMPKHRYSYGPELRAYANLIADKWQLKDKAIFSSTVKQAAWDDELAQWKTTICLDRFDGDSFTIASDFLMVAAGVLNTPKIPKIPGMGDFNGHVFHTSRWDYNYTGGSPEHPNLDKLKDKRVALIGTGATAIQCIPKLAEAAKEVYVFQRTPSSVDKRGQQETDVDWFKRMTSKPGWSQQRSDNFAAHQSNCPDKGEDMVNDGWSTFPSYSALVGGPATEGLSRENIQQYLEALHALDFPRAERIRARVDSIVKDPSTAQALKPYYPGWCKRPCFHDDYLETFNRPNVHLIDTAGAGVTRLTEDSIVFQDKEYQVDCLVLSTGYLVGASGPGSPVSRAGVAVTGRGGMTMDEKWERGVATLHGIVTRDLPNMFFPGPSQGAATANYSSVLDYYARQTAYILGEGLKRYGGGRFVVEPTTEGEEAWTVRIMPQAIAFAPMMGCTPSYLNMEGEIEKEKTPEEQMKGARGAMWSKGWLDYKRVIGEWEQEGKLDGLEMRAVK